MACLCFHKNPSGHSWKRTAVPKPLGFATHFVIHDGLRGHHWLAGHQALWVATQKLFLGIIGHLALHHTMHSQTGGSWPYLWLVAGLPWPGGCRAAWGTMRHDIANEESHLCIMWHNDARFLVIAGCDPLKLGGNPEFGTCWNRTLD